MKEIFGASMGLSLGLVFLLIYGWCLLCLDPQPGFQAGTWNYAPAK